MSVNIPQKPTPPFSPRTGRHPPAPTEHELIQKPHATIAITVYYIDSFNRLLHQPITIHGAYQADLTIPWKTLPGYLLYDIYHFQRQFLPNPDGIYLVYTKQLAAPVLAYHEDEQGRLLQKPTMLRGELNRPYQLRPLSKYLAQLQSVRGPSRGHFQNKAQQIHFRYRLSTQQVTHPFQHNGVKLRKNKKAYATPKMTQPLRGYLPHGSTWQIYQTVKDLRNHQLWFNLGGDLWLDSLNTQLVDIKSPSSIQTPNHQAYGLPTFAIRKVDAQIKSAIIKASPDFPISQWTKPYGQIAPQRLANQTRVVVTKQITLDNESQWCLLEHGYYVERKYLRFN